MSLSESKVTDVLPVESPTSALAWGPIIGGAVAATGITLILLLVGSGMGLTMVSPWSGENSSAATVGVSAAIWLVVVQWLSAALGGYLTGRLRTKWAAAHTDGPRLSQLGFGNAVRGRVSGVVLDVPCRSRRERCGHCCQYGGHRSGGR